MDKLPEYEEHGRFGSVHPAPLVIHPVKKLLQSELLLSVLGA